MVTFKNIRFFNENDDKIFFKLGDFGKITTKLDNVTNVLHNSLTILCGENSTQDN